MSDREGLALLRCLRVGCGVDAHAFADGRRLVLGGVWIRDERGLAGHSDADVLTHAVIDALLGAARLGDIGRWFPSGDDRWRDADSQVLLAHVVERLRELEIEIVNVDAVVIAQRPRLAAHLDAMEATLAATLRVPPGCVSVKATTTDRLGTIGRAEGIAAQAVALLLNRRD